MFHHVEGCKRLEHGHIDLLALAGAQPVHERKHDCIGGMHATDLVGHDGGNEAGFTRHDALQTGKPRGRLDDIVVGRASAVGAMIGVARDMAVNQGGVDPPKHSVIEPQAPGCGCTHRVQQHIALRNQSVENLLAFRALEIDHNAALVAVRGQEKRAHPG
jgi:hypothetical protein